jgi:DNA repair protein RecO
MEAGASLLSAVRRLFPGEEASVPAFNLLVRGVAQLAEAGDAGAAANAVLATRVKLLVLLGYSPETGICAGCGCEGPFCGFSPDLGGVVCEACWTDDTRTSFSLSAGAVATLQVLLERSLTELEGLEIDDRAAAEVEQVLAQTLAYHGH